MFGLNQKGVNAYAKVGMETGVLAASPNKLIIMLYEGAIAACRSADSHMQSKDIANKGLMISKAISIIESGLRLSLDKKAGGEIAISLDALYAYMSKQLMTANIHNKPELIHEVIKLLTELKGAWEAIDNVKMPTKDMAMAIPSQTAIKVNHNIANYAKA
ncbi:MAG: flagellar export chaperone FliS [Methylotenera sp.]|uniref:flagellar export chaperone FliS n=1 Tax=Methylotenera sp. TaxID=2051956 RepID=UPI0024891CBD|nr:flagellar export chaperone FliS [Methylotenera sp.]MDI1308500.1 flagellar export chaperone FliS [Methylotenera sp.]